MVTGKKVILRYMHMDSYIKRDTDQPISQGTLLGYVGNTGQSGGTHLHVDANTGGHTSGSDLRSNPRTLLMLPDMFYSDIDMKPSVVIND